MKLTTEKETVILRGPRPEDSFWGPYQFPRPFSRGDGRIAVSVNIGKDDIHSDSTAWLESLDNGLTWKETDASVACECGLLLPDGDRLFFPQETAQKLDGYEFPDFSYLTPGYDFSKKASGKHMPMQDGMTAWFTGALIRAYKAERLPAPLDKKEWTVKRIKCGETEAVTEKARLDWPYLTRVVFSYGNKNEGAMKSIQPRGNSKIGPDGAIWVSAFSGEGHIDPNTGLYNPYYSAELFRSEDNGKTFVQRAHMEYPADGSCDYPYLSGGFSDSDFEFLDDGSMIWFLRSAWMASTGYEWAPMYVSRSKDMGRTWSKPKKFAFTGILPRLCKLECGVILLCYARPGIFVQATESHDGVAWSEPLTVMTPDDRSALANVKPDVIRFHDWDGACNNPEMIPVGKNEVLLFYSDFYYPDEYGVKRKTILCRRIRVEM